MIDTFPSTLTWEGDGLSRNFELRFTSYDAASAELRINGIPTTAFTLNAGTLSLPVAPPPYSSIALKIRVDQETYVGGFNFAYQASVEAGLAAYGAPTRADLMTDNVDYEQVEAALSDALVTLNVALESDIAPQTVVGLTEYQAATKQDVESVKAFIQQNGTGSGTGGSTTSSSFAGQVEIFAPVNNAPMPIGYVPVSATPAISVNNAFLETKGKSSVNNYNSQIPFFNYISKPGRVFCMGQGAGGTAFIETDTTTLETLSTTQVATISQGGLTNDNIGGFLAQSASNSNVISIIDGIAEQTDLLTHTRYDTSSKTSTPDGALPLVRSIGGALGQSGGFLYLFGGKANGAGLQNSVNRIERYNPVSNNFTAMPGSLPGYPAIIDSTFRHATATLPNGRILVVYGSSYAVYDPAQSGGLVISSGSAPMPRCLGLVATSNSIVGLFSNTPGVNLFYVFTEATGFQSMNVTLQGVGPSLSNGNPATHNCLGALGGDRGIIVGIIRWDPLKIVEPVLNMNYSPSPFFYIAKT